MVQISPCVGLRIGAVCHESKFHSHCRGCGALFFDPAKLLSHDASLGCSKRLRGDGGGGGATGHHEVQIDLVDGAVYGGGAAPAHAPADAGPALGGGVQPAAARERIVPLADLPGIMESLGSIEVDPHDKDGEVVVGVQDFAGGGDSEEEDGEEDAEVQMARPPLPVDVLAALDKAVEDARKDGVDSFGAKRIVDNPNVKPSLWLAKLVRTLQNHKGARGMHDVLLEELRAFAAENGGSITSELLAKIVNGDATNALVDSILELDHCPPPTVINVSLFPGQEPTLVALPDLFWYIRMALTDPGNAGAFTPIQDVPGGMASGPPCTSSAARAMEKRYAESWKASSLRESLVQKFPDASIEMLVVVGSLTNDGAAVGTGRNTEFNCALYMAHMFHPFLEGEKKGLIPLAVFKKIKLGSPATAAQKMMVDDALQIISGKILQQFYGGVAQDGKKRGPLLIWGKDSNGVLPSHDAAGKEILHCINLGVLNNLMDKGESSRSVLCSSFCDHCCALHWYEVVDGVVRGKDAGGEHVDDNAGAGAGGAAAAAGGAAAGGGAAAAAAAAAPVAAAGPLGAAPPHDWTFLLEVYRTIGKALEILQKQGSIPLPARGQAVKAAEAALVTCRANLRRMGFDPNHLRPCWTQIDESQLEHFSFSLYPNSSWPDSTTFDYLHSLLEGLIPDTTNVCATAAARSRGLNAATAAIHALGNQALRLLMRLQNLQPSFDDGRNNYRVKGGMGAANTSLTAGEKLAQVGLTVACLTSDVVPDDRIRTQQHALGPLSCGAHNG